MISNLTQRRYPLTWESTLTLVLGALASACGQEKVVMDTAVWLAAVKDETGLFPPGLGASSIAHETIAALRGIGVLDEIAVTKEGLAVYPAELTAASEE
jgi:hypothetical protein